MAKQKTKMTLKKVLAELEALSNEKMYAQNKKNGAGDNQYGVRLGEIRKFAKKIETNSELAMSLWDTNNIDARLLAILLIKPKALSSKEVDQMVQAVNFTQVADWLSAYIVKHHSDKETLRKNWMTSDDPMAARAGWSLTDERVEKNPEGLDLSAILDRIESEMANAASEVQWTMNFTLAKIGIHCPNHRERAISIGEKLGLYRDYPVSKGCTSPFAPIWITEMVKRQSTK